MAERGDEDDVRVLWIDNDAANLARLLEPDVLPGLAGVGGFVHAVAELDRIAHVGFAGADIDDVRIRRRDSNRANRCRRGRVEHRRPGAPAIRGFPNAAAYRTKIKSLRLSDDAADGVDAPR